MKENDLTYERSLDAPILFLVFNRPSSTKKVFEEIKKAKPKRLYIAADGHRESFVGEFEKTLEVRKIVSQIDWKCEFKTLFRDENLGCKKAVSEAIDWFFDQEESGIILEDDCLPSQSFFWFCQDMLEKYKFDNRVGQISGTNILESFDTESSYFFSNFGGIWGWATWKRAWNFYDVNMRDWSKISNEKYNLRKIIGSYIDYKIRYRNFQLTYEGHIDTWDYQWIFARLMNRMLIIIPRVNLVTNIGFSKDATHTNSENSRTSELKRFDIDRNYIHPQGIFPRYDFEKKVRSKKRGAFGCSLSYCLPRILRKIFFWRKNG